VSSMTDKTVLINFYVDKKLKETFDALCEAHSRTRTSMLIELMEKAIIHKTAEVALWNEELKKVDDVLAEHKRLLRQRYKASGKERVYEEDIEEPIGIWMPGMEDDISDSNW
jgi:hypothetical protein